MTRQSVPATRVDRVGVRWTLFATSLGFAMVQLDVSIVNVAIKPIGAALGGGVSGLQWVVNAYTVAFAGLILSAGALGDRVGAKRIFVAGFVLFTLASASCGLAPNLHALIASRTIQGAGASSLVPCSLALLNHSYPEPADRLRAVGLWAAGASTALSAGPLVSGALIAALGWRWIFFINAPLGLAGILLTARWASETPPARDRAVDVSGQLAAIVSLTALAAAFIEGGSRGYTDLGVLSGFAVAAAAGAVFVVVEARRDQPMVPLRIFASRTFAAATAMGLLVNVGFYGLIFVFSLYFQKTLHYSPLVTGLAFGPMAALILAANLLASRASSLIGPRRVIALGALLTAAGCSALLGVSGTTPYEAVVGQLAAMGLGLGLLVPAITSSLLGSVDRSRSGIASGTLNAARQTGSVIGVALFGSLIADSTRIVPGLHTALGISTGLALAVAALAARIEQPATEHSL